MWRDTHTHTHTKEEYLNKGWTLTYTLDEMDHLVIISSRFI